MMLERQCKKEEKGKMQKEAGEQAGEIYVCLSQATIDNRQRGWVKNSNSFLSCLLCLLEYEVFE